MAHYYQQLGFRRVAEWEVSFDGWVPHDKAVVGGHDVNGERIFIGRAHHEDEVIPGKIVPSHGKCYIPYGGREHGRHEYQVLTSPDGLDLIWVHVSSGHEVPTGAIQGGYTGSGEPLFIGRAHHEGSHCVGKVHPSHGCLYIPFGGDEITVRHNFEVLCVKHVSL